MSRMAQRNAARIRDGVEEIFNRGNLAAVDERFAPDVVFHSPAPGSPIVGARNVKQFLRTLRTAFPDLHMDVDDLVADGERVVTRSTTTGTHAGDYFGVPPTGRRVSITEIHIFRLVDGRLVEVWLVFDVLDVLRQLGVVPAGGFPRPLLRVIAAVRRRRDQARSRRP